MLDAYALGSMLQIADDLVLETAVDLAGGRGYSMPQEAHHVQALEGAHGMVEEGRVVLLERLRFFKDQIGGVCALSHCPVVAKRGQRSQDFALEGMSLLE